VGRIGANWFFEVRWMRHLVYSTPDCLPSAGATLCLRSATIGYETAAALRPANPNDFGMAGAVRKPSTVSQHHRGPIDGGCCF
jgi:hypothetical protein